MSFTYNDDGLRTTKTVNGVTTTYYYQGSLLIAEETNSQILVYLYDSNGAPIGFKYRGSSYASGVWDIYGYEKNLQGDIIGVYDTATGNKLIGYKYNAWGTCTTSYYNSGMNTTATKNPFKYRGYYYDSDLGLYYLQSRYYDQNTGRFINADSALYHSMLGYNMFAYCDNNPVNYYDPTGENEEVIYLPIYTAWLPLIDGPLPIGEILYLGLFIVVVVVILQADEIPPPAIADSEKENVLIDFTSNESSTELTLEVTDKEYDPDPYGRPGQKKQGDSLKNKARTKKGWKPRNNRRDGKPAPPKKHTPARDHKKKFSSCSIYNDIYIFGE